MRRIPILALAFFLAPAAFPSDGVKIIGVGLKGYWSPGEPTEVRVLLLHNDARAATVELRVRVRGESETGIERVDSFTQNVALGANGQRVVSVPVFLFHEKKPLLEVEEVDEKGGVLASDASPFEPPLSGSLIALVCASPNVCQEAQSQISFSGTSSEQTQKGKFLKFVSLENPPDIWWGYFPAKTIVLAEAITQLNAAQQEAVEGFVREGGRLVVVQSPGERSGFLEVYRALAPAGTSTAVGRGRVTWVSSLASKELGELFATSGLRFLAERLQAMAAMKDELNWARKRLATRFRFPTLGWLLGWLGAYTLVAGLGNFALLRRLGRREWGWITLPCLSIVFALGMYLSSASKRPRETRVEDVAVYWMDESSSLAAIERGDRISSPHRQTVEFGVEGDEILAGDMNNTGSILKLNLFDEDAGDLKQVWKVQAGPSPSVEVRTLQWSFRDLEFYGLKRLPGTVRRVGAGHLRNETGMSFRQGMYVDKQTVYTMEAVPAGADIDLSAAKQTPLANATGNRLASAWSFPTELTEVDNTNWPDNNAVGGAGDPGSANQDPRGIAQKPFELSELIRGWVPGGGHAFDTRSGLFFGLADDANPPVSLTGARFERKGYSITIVSFGQRP